MKWPSPFRRIGHLLFGAFLCFTLAAEAALSPEEAVNKAGRQRMLSQQVVKIYNQLGQEVDMADGAKELKAAVELFDKQMAELKEQASDPESSAAYAKMAESWAPMKQVAGQAVSRDKAEQLYSDGEKVLEASNKFTDALIVRYKNDILKLINTSGRQRMLAHRVAANYLMLSWGFTGARYRTNYDAAVAEFEDNMTNLLTDPRSTPQITDLFKQASKKWNNFKNSAQIDSGKYYSGMVVTLLNKIHALMDEATQLYVAAK